MRWRILHDDDTRRFRPALTNPAAVSRSRALDRPARLQPLARPARGARVHLSIGQAYAFSVFNLPLTQLSRRHAVHPRRLEAHRRSAGSSRIAIVFLGLSAAVFGKWLEARRPAQGDVRRRRCCFGGGVPGLGARRRTCTSSGCSTSATACSAASASASATSRRSPRSSSGSPTGPGMATGMAIMGFGGGAMIGVAAVGDADGHVRRSPTSPAWSQTFVALGLHLLRAS